MTNLDDIKTHVDDMFAAGTIVTSAGVTLECIAEVTTVEVMVSQPDSIA